MLFEILIEDGDGKPVTVFGVGKDFKEFEEFYLNKTILNHPTAKIQIWEINDNLKRTHKEPFIAPCYNSLVKDDFNKKVDALDDFFINKLGIPKDLIEITKENFLKDDLINPKK